MALAPQKELKEAMQILSHHIDEGIELDQLTFRRYLKKFENIKDEPLKLMLFGLVYGAAKKHAEAIPFFKESVKYKDDVAARNYLTYLGRTHQFEMYRDESERLAKEISSFPLCIRARNAAYSDGDVQLSLFFARKAIALTSDPDVIRNLKMDINNHMHSLNEFIANSGLSSEEIKDLSRRISSVARRYNVLSISTEFYVSADGHDLAIINDVLNMDDDVISDMDIEVACEIAMLEKYSDKNITAWFRGRDRENVGYTI